MSGISNRFLTSIVFALTVLGFNLILYNLTNSTITTCLIYVNHNATSSEIPDYRQVHQKHTCECDPVITDPISIGTTTGFTGTTGVIVSTGSTGTTGTTGEIAKPVLTTGTTGEVARSASRNRVVAVLVNPHIISHARWLVGSLHRHSPDERIVAFHYGLHSQHISELNFWHNVIVIADDIARNDTDTYEHMMRRVVRNAAELFGSAIIVHPDLRVTRQESVDELFRMLEEGGSLRGKFEDRNDCVFGAIRGVHSDVGVTRIRNIIEMGDIGSLCTLRHIYRLPTEPLFDVTKDTRPRICMGVPTMSLNGKPMLELPILKTILDKDSLWHTIKKNDESKYFYSLYLGYDEGDKLFDDDGIYDFLAEVYRRAQGHAFDLHALRFPPVAQDPV